MNAKYEFYNLPVFIFVFALLLQGCSFNFSVGNKITDSEAETLATKTLQNFNRSLERGDFDAFHRDEIAASVTNNLTTEKLNTTFAPFIKQKIDIRPKEGAKINLSPPSIDGQYLNLSGGYPAHTGKNVGFKLQYIKEANDWRLKYIDVNVS